MKLRYTRILSLLLCAALACSILAGCGGSTASSSEAPSSASSSASSAASGEDLHHPGRHLRPEPRRF